MMPLVSMLLLWSSALGWESTGKGCGCTRRAAIWPSSQHMCANRLYHLRARDDFIHPELLDKSVFWDSRSQHFSNIATWTEWGSAWNMWGISCQTFQPERSNVLHCLRLRSSAALADSSLPASRNPVVESLPTWKAVAEKRWEVCVIYYLAQGIMGVPGGGRWSTKTRDPCKRSCRTLVVHLGAFKSQLVAIIVLSSWF